MSRRIASILLLISSINAENLSQLLQDSTATLVKTATANQQHQQQFIQILHTIIGAIRLTYAFFISLFFLVYKCTTTILSPIMWLACNLWSGFVAKPYHLLMHIAHVLYPVTLFCAAAIFCGLFIGGCAGFAAEAFSSILISATWGPQAKVIEEEELLLAEDDSIKKSEKTDEEEEPIVKSSASSSIWENSSSFFGVHQHKKKEKEPLVQKPKVELWRESIADSPPPVMIRRMKLSSSQRKNGWDWDEDEDEMYHPTSSKKHI